MSEAYLDAPRDMRRVRFAGFSGDSIAGVSFVDGEALSGMSEASVARLRGLGLPIEDLGPWSVVTPSEPASLAPEPPPSSGVSDAAPDPSNADAEPADTGDASPATEAPTKPRKTPR